MLSLISISTQSMDSLPGRSNEKPASKTQIILNKVKTAVEEAIIKAKIANIKEKVGKAIKSATEKTEQASITVKNKNLEAALLRVNDAAKQLNLDLLKTLAIKRELQEEFSREEEEEINRQLKKAFDNLEYLLEEKLRLLQVLIKLK